ncbi:MAG: hypothetical protein WAN60_04490 [Candidatus Sulfotelmatobacter sp.]
MKNSKTIQIVQAANVKDFSRKERKENPQSPQSNPDHPFLSAPLFFASLAAFLCDLSGQKLFCHEASIMSGTRAQRE